MTEILAEQGREAKETLETLLSYMGVSAIVGIKQDGEQLVLDVHGDDADQLIGNKGQTLDALQLIVNRIVSRKLDDMRPLTVDAAGYRQRRADSLGELAVRLKDKALSSGRVVALNPMSARDRRIIHMTLKDVEGVSTRSEGEGAERRLLIVPESESESE